MSQFIIPLILAVLAALWFIAFVVLRKTNPGASRLSLNGGVVAVAMVVALIYVIAKKVPISAIVAVPLFVATILEFGFIIALTSKTLSGKISQPSFMVGVLVIITGILLGVVLMFQPGTPVVFNLGFDFVLIALLAFNVWSHIAPRPAGRK